jgi:undecaprenyl-diphosphatase
MFMFSLTLWIARRRPRADGDTGGRDGKVLITATSICAGDDTSRRIVGRSVGSPPVSWLRRPGVRVGEAVAVVGGAVLLTGSWVVVAVAGHVPAWEARVFGDVNDLPGWLWTPLRVPMQLGSFVGSLLVVAATALVSRNVRLTLAALLASQAAFWTAKGVKDLARRGRPDALLADVHLREDAGGFGYLSGHAAVAFSLAAVLAPEVPARWQLALVVAAVVVAVARVYAGVHLPLDVVGGAGLGLLCGTLARWALGLGGEGLAPRDQM